MATLHVGGRFLHFYVIAFKSLRYRHPHASDVVAFSEVSTPESVFKSLPLQCAFSPDTCARMPDP